MPNCRRNPLPSKTYRFTVNLRDRRSDLLVAEIERAGRLDIVARRDACRGRRAARLAATARRMRSNFSILFGQG
jgi:hypothetical protein